MDLEKDMEDKKVNFWLDVSLFIEMNMRSAMITIFSQQIIGATLLLVII